MIKYGLDTVTELTIIAFEPRIERRDAQWVDIVLRATIAEPTPLPDDMIDFTVLVICTLDGTIAQIVPQDEDCDCEYNFTVGEKEQIAAFVEGTDVQSAIANLSSP
jgi:hypothetical protein